MSLKRSFRFLTILSDVYRVGLSSIKPYMIITINNFINIYLGYIVILRNTIENLGKIKVDLGTIKMT